MYCPNCGKLNPEGASFCSACGTRLSAGSGENPTEDSAVRYNQSQSVLLTEYPNQKRKLPKAGKWIIAAVAVIVLIVAVKTAYRPTVDLNECLTITIDGYDGYGRAEATVDSDEFQSRYAKKLKVDQRALDEYLNIPISSEDDPQWDLWEFASRVDYYGDNLSKRSVTELFDGYFLSYTGSVYPQEYLSNGDEVTYSWNIDEELLKEAEEIFHCKIKYGNTSVTVKDLKEPGTYDPFEYLSIEYGGSNHYGYAILNNTDEDGMGGEVYYTIKGKPEEIEGQMLSNGDEITVVAESCNGDDWDAEHYGKTIAPTEKTYTVSGLYELMTSASELTEEESQTLNQTMQPMVEDYVAKNWLADGESIIETTCVGYRFYLIKNTEAADRQNYPTGDSYNMYALFYKVRIKNENTSRAIYTMGLYKNIKSTGDMERQDATPCPNAAQFDSLDELRKWLQEDTDVETNYTCEDHLGVF